ncbi:MAG: 50S ribosomal protein L23 [Leptospiraceae bacterium]|nr:50S ribosomal protein L23 [Leptospiraceae bacterium]MCP5511862.1 50S ribosomal protein L23 [Leptospiraceae bacterium]
MNLEDVIIAPLVTEKSQNLQEIGKENQGKRMVKYVFRVHPDANKVLVKDAIKKIFNVSPSSVNIMVYKGKVKRFRNFPSPRPHWKKAIVTFDNGANLEFGKGV